MNDSPAGLQVVSRVASAGEALVDLIPEMDGDQIVLRVSPGGSPYNVAIGLARLGLHASYAGRLSTDVFGRLLELRLADESVDSSLMMRGPERTALAIVGRVGDEAIYDFRWSGTADRSYDPTSLPMEAFEKLDALHVGSAALGIDPVGARLLRLMEQLHGKVFLSFDPNVRRDVVDDWHEYLNRVRRAFELADLVKISTVDLAAIGEDTRWESEMLGRKGPTVLTAGADGSSVHRADHPVVRVPAPRTVVRDTVGAGDALMAGLIYALSGHDALDRAGIEALSDVAWGTVLTIANTAGAMTCERVGADPPTAEALQERLGA